MKRLVFFIAVSMMMVIMGGCKSSRTATIEATHTHIATAKADSVVVVRADSFDIRTTLVQHTDTEQMTALIRVYDTSKPIGADGRPPLRAEIEINRERHADDIVERGSEVSVLRVDSVQVATSYSIEAVAEVKAEEKKQPPSRWRGWQLGIIVGLLISAAIYYYLKRLT